MSINFWLQKTTPDSIFPNIIVPMSCAPEEKEKKKELKHNHNQFYEMWKLHTSYRINMNRRRRKKRKHKKKKKQSHKDTLSRKEKSHFKSLRLLTNTIQEREIPL